MSDNLTPLERLEAWRSGGEKRDFVLGSDYDKPHEKTYCAGLWVGRFRVAWALAPTLDAAILAAIDAAQGESHE